MDSGVQFTLKFWGVRGSIPTPQVENLRYGGNTTCLEIRAPGEEPVVIDTGSGARLLGAQLIAEPFTTLLFTHFHWDHIQGLPFFAPLFRKETKVTLASSHKTQDLQEVFNGLLRYPFHPIDFDYFSAAIEMMQVSGTWHHAGFQIRPFALHHPQGATGYRLERNGAVLVHASDHEHGNALADQVLLEHSQKADVLVYDAQYTTEEYQLQKGRGHSTWLEAVKLAAKAEVNRLVLFHHDPGHSDDMLEAILAEAQREFASTSLAREGDLLQV
jgi:phosphoribosyl 1,2-cyclic phosphodiesterase